MYIAIKHSHMLFAVISGLFFLVRGAWMLMDSGMLQKKWVKILPHINDSLLLLCAIGLSVMSHQYPIAQDWLTVKVLALIAYIVLGVIALKKAKPKGFVLWRWWGLCSPLYLPFRLPVPIIPWAFSAY